VPTAAQLQTDGHIGELELDNACYKAFLLLLSSTYITPVLCCFQGMISVYNWLHDTDCKAEAELL